jgi:beta-glucosidase
MPEATLHFPPDFLWGTATAAHQVEGNNHNNDWWHWEQKGGGRVFRDQTSGLACDWWEGRAEEDIARMKALNTNTHRLSIEWSRIEMKEGEFNTHAIDRYRAILGTMRDSGIEPMVTLHHFTNPLWVAFNDGWLSDDTPWRFERFVKKAVQELSDLVSTWCTVNEPNVFASEGYFAGKWPPGQKEIPAYFRVLRNVLEGHALAYRAIKEVQPQASVGLAKHIVFFAPRSSSFPDHIITNLLDRAFNGVTLDALQTGEWRPVLGEKATVAHWTNTLDWVGVNYYTRSDAFFDLRKLSQLGINYGPRPGKPQGPGTWGELYPQGLFESIKRVWNQFGLPIYITESGVPDETDQLRPAWILENLRWVWKAINFNWPVKGYYFWSLLDNFEWAEGYDPRYRFGLYATDFETQQRTLRDSGKLYAEIAKSYAITTDMVRRYAPDAVSAIFPGGPPAAAE